MAVQADINELEEEVGSGSCVVDLGAKCDALLAKASGTFMAKAPKGDDKALQIKVIREAIF